MEGADTAVVLTEGLFRLLVACFCLEGALGELLRQGSLDAPGHVALAVYSLMPLLMWAPLAALRAVAAVVFLSLFPVLVAMQHPQSSLHNLVVFCGVTLLGGILVGFVLTEHHDDEEHHQRREAAPPPPPLDTEAVLGRILLGEGPPGECCICLGPTLHRLRDCRHSLCRDCAEAYLLALRQPGTGLGTTPVTVGDMACPLCRTPYRVEGKIFEEVMAPDDFPSYDECLKMTDEQRELTPCLTCFWPRNWNRWEKGQQPNEAPEEEEAAEGGGRGAGGGGGGPRHRRRH